MQKLKKKAVYIHCSWKCRTSSINNRRSCILKKKKFLKSSHPRPNANECIPGWLMCPAGQGAGLHVCAADVLLPRLSFFAGVFSAWAGPKLMGGVPRMSQQPQPRVMARQAACEVSGAWFLGQPVLHDSWDQWAQLQGGHKPFERYCFFRLSLGFLRSSWCISLGNATSEKHTFRLQVALEQLYCG